MEGLNGITGEALDATWSEKDPKWWLSTKNLISIPEELYVNESL